MSNFRKFKYFTIQYLIYRSDSKCSCWDLGKVILTVAPACFHTCHVHLHVVCSSFTHISIFIWPGDLILLSASRCVHVWTLCACVCRSCEDVCHHQFHANDNKRKQDCIKFTLI